jgi:protein O-GlcNAc transferase
VSDDLFSRALDHHRAGRLGDAEAGYRQALESDPDAPRILHQLGLLALQTNRPTLALSWLERACARNPESDDSRRLLAQAFVAAGQRESALACLRTRTEMEPLSAEAWIDYATLCQQVAPCRRSHSRLPRGSSTPAVQCGPARQCGSVVAPEWGPEAAQAALEQAVQLDPCLAPAHATLGRVWQDLGLLAAAEQAFLRARSLAPGLISVHLDLGNLLLVSGRNEDAVTRFAEAVALHPDQPDLLVSLGTALRAVGRSDEAVAVLQRSVSLAPGLAAAHNNLANARLDQGRPADAAVSFRHALTAAPAEASYHSNLILALHYADAPVSVLHDAFAAWNRRVPPALRSALGPAPARHARLRPDRLRVGLVSADLREHPSDGFSSACSRRVPPPVSSGWRIRTPCAKTG